MEGKIPYVGEEEGGGGDGELGEAFVGGVTADGGGGGADGTSGAGGGGEGNTQKSGDVCSQSLDNAGVQP